MREPGWLLIGLIGVACECKACDPEYGGGACAPICLENDPKNCSVRDAQSAGGKGGKGGTGGTSGTGCGPDAGVQYSWVDAACVAEGCVYGRGDCNNDLLKDGCEIGISVHEGHCGRCENVCAEQICEHGSCGAEVFAASPYDVTALFSDGNAVYYAIHEGSSLVYFAPPAAAPTTLYSANEPVRDIQLSGNFLVMRVGDLEIHVIDLAIGMTSAIGLAPVASDFVFATDPTWLFIVGTGAATTLDGGADASDPDATAAGGSAGAAGVSNVAGAAGGSVADVSLDSAPADTTLVSRFPLESGAEEPLLALPGTARAVDESSGVLYVAVSNPSRLFAIPTTSLLPTVIAQDGFEATRIVESAGYVYIADALGNRIARVPVTGGPIEHVLSVFGTPFDLKIDGSSFWFTTTDPAELWTNALSEAVFVAGLLRPDTPVALDAGYVYWSASGVGVMRHMR